jgi:hypothetical protein
MNRTAVLFAVLLSSVALAQTAPVLTLPRAIATATAENLDLKNATAAVVQARATFAARDADPTALITDVLQARHSLELATVQAASARLEVVSDTVNDFLNLAENTDSVQYLDEQVKLSTRNLEITRARLQARTATPVDVQRAETELAGARQQLGDARAQRPIIAARLGRLLGFERGVEPNIAEPEALRVRSVNLAALETGLDDRVLTVVRAAQAVEFAELIVKVSDNDYTPEQTKREAGTNLEAARRALSTERRKALTTLRDTNRAVGDALEGARVAQKNAEAAAQTFRNDTVRLQNGLIARVQLEASALSNRKAQVDAVRAANGYVRALAGLSLAGGVDVTGLVSP